jgi:hypothetical protein
MTLLIAGVVAFACIRLISAPQSVDNYCRRPLDSMIAQFLARMAQLHPILVGVPVVDLGSASRTG